MTILSILAAILLLGILVVVHEFGHFIAARMTGIAVQAFSIGFGPKLVHWKSKKHETEFMIRGFPFGGYCMFYGEEDAEGKLQNDPRAYHRQSVWKRIFSVLMGPAMNFVLAFVVAVGMFFFAGIHEVIPYVPSLETDGPAAQAGMQAGDILYAVNGQNVQDGSTDTVIQFIGAYKEGDGPLAIEVVRGENEEHITLSITPFYDAAESRYRVGIVVGGTYGDKMTPVSFVESVRLSYDTCLNASKVILVGLRDLIFKGEGLEQSSGPVGIVQVISQQTLAFGLEGYINLLIIFSINLGLVNLLPIPGLDGSRFLFMLVEVIRRKPINQRVEAVVHLTGYALLLGVMLFFTYHDIIRLFS